MKITASVSAICLGMLTYSLVAQAQMQTYSPYTPEQIKAFNEQPLSPTETPEGPIYGPNQAPVAKSQNALPKNYVSQQRGEQEAEAQETESATPFDPMAATLRF